MQLFSHLLEIHSHLFAHSLSDSSMMEVGSALFWRRENQRKGREKIVDYTVRNCVYYCTIIELESCKNVKEKAKTENESKEERFFE